jgi:hypothetical protein
LFNFQATFGQLKNGKIIVNTCESSSYIDTIADNTKTYLQSKHDKSRGPIDRYYNYVYGLDTMHTFLGQDPVLISKNRSFIPLWQDSTILVNYTNGISKIQYRMVFNIFYPNCEVFNHPSWNNSGSLVLNKNFSYTVDTIWVQGAYFINKPNLTGDSLILSVVKSQAPDNQEVLYVYNQTDYPILKSIYYGSNSNDTTMLTPNLKVDSIEICAGDQAVYRQQISYKFEYEDSNQLKFYAFPLKTPISIQPGEYLGFSLKFVSGANWIPNSTLIYDMNYFRVTTFEETDSSFITYRAGEYGGGDLNTTGYMFSHQNNVVYSATEIEGLSNDKIFANEYLNCIYHVKSQTAWPLEVENDNTIDAYLYPTIVKDHQLFIHTNQEINLAFYSISGFKIYEQTLNASQKIDLPETANKILYYSIDAKDKKRKQGKILLR